MESLRDDDQAKGEEADKRRAEPRMPISVRIALKYDDGNEVVSNKTLDLSTGGAYIRTRETRPPGTAVRLRINIGPKFAYIDGIVKHEVPVDDDNMTIPGIGVEFESVTDEAVKLIDQVLARHRRALG